MGGVDRYQPAHPWGSGPAQPAGDTAKLSERGERMSVRRTEQGLGGCGGGLGGNVPLRSRHLSCWKHKKSVTVAALGKGLGVRGRRKTSFSWFFLLIVFYMSVCLILLMS